MSRFTLPADAHAIRPVRFKEGQEDAWAYEAVSFDGESRAGVDMWLRRLGHDVLGEEDDGEYRLDILNEGGDIVAEFPIAEAGFNYLRSRLKFRRDWQGAAS